MEVTISERNIILRALYYTDRKKYNSARIKESSFIRMNSIYRELKKIQKRRKNDPTKFRSRGNLSKLSCGELAGELATELKWIIWIEEGS